MSKDFKGKEWDAPPHTEAKIRILKDYLDAWFPIFGQKFIGKELLVIDGFAGPGAYANGVEGSPIVGLRSATKALNHGGWKAGSIHYALIEERIEYFESMRRRTEGFGLERRLKLHYYHSDFTSGIDAIRKDLPDFFKNRLPLFAFVDPFGPTGAHFMTIRTLLGSPASEVLINFDHDGISRILRAYAAGGVAQEANSRNLDNIFGSDIWKTLLHLTGKRLALAALNLYKNELRKIPNVDYLFSFDMRDVRDQSSYHLLFASQHPLGLIKMKDAMRKMDQSGEYRFSDARVDQENLFVFDDPSVSAPQIQTHFANRLVSREEVLKYILNETPFTTLPKALKPLDLEDLLITSPIEKRTKGTFPDGKVTHIKFLTR
jgi:three-Cys-motif partner protein